MDVAELTSGVRLSRRDYRPAKKPERVENGYNDYLLVLPLTHGRIKLERDGVVVHDGPVRPGTLRIVQPGECSRITPGAVFESAMFTVPSETFRRTARSQDFPLDPAGRPRVLPILQARHDIQRLVPLLRTTSELRGPKLDLLASGLVVALLAMALNAEAHAVVQRTCGFGGEQFETVLAFARSRLAEHLDLGEWAESVQLSTHEFARRFHQHTGVAPYTWFLDLRIEEAKRLLNETALPLAEIALTSGFCSQSHFTEAFRRRIGSSPGRWRATRADDAGTVSLRKR